MAIKIYRPTSPGRRGMTVASFADGAVDQKGWS
jgi:ribosomal protein L2